MPRVARQAQSVCPLPGADANIRRISKRALLFEQQLAFLQTLFGFVGHAFGVSPDELRGARRCRCLVSREVLQSGCP